jgi:hypothetical protein
MAILVDFDPNTGLETWVEVADGKLNVGTRQDVTPVLERNKILQNDDEYKKQGIKAGFYHAASIPMEVVNKWMAEGINIFDKNATAAIKRKLNDPEYAYLRTGLGRV